MKTVVITGASSGIGFGIAKALSARDMQVFASVRSDQDARRLVSALPNVKPLLFDVTDQAGVRAGVDIVRKTLSGHTLYGLVNNAGIALPGPVLHQPVDDYRKQIEVNLIGTFMVSQAFAPLLGADRTLTGPPGRIVNISSLGGKIGSPLLAGYCSAKHGMEGLSESLRRELLLYGVDVVIVAPGAVKTPIWDKAQHSEQRYANSDYGAAMKALAGLMEGAARDGLEVDRVAGIVHHALSVPRPRVRYTLTPSYLFDWLLPRLLPPRWIDRMFAKRLSLMR